MNYPDRSALPRPISDQNVAEDASILQTLQRIRQDARLIGVVVVFCVSIGLLYALFAERTYEADALVQVMQEKSPLTGAADLNNLLGTYQRSTAEIEVIKSRSVLSKVVQRLHLDISAEPRRLPLFGALAANRYRGSNPAPARLGLASFDWGGDDIGISRFDVPEILEGVSFGLTASGGARFTLRNPELGNAVPGTAGQALTADTSQGPISLLVDEVHARPEVQFLVTRLNTDDVVQRLQMKLQVAELSKQTGILRVALQGADPRKTAGIINAVVDAYVQQNVEQQSKETSRMLDFIESQLPQVKLQVDASESALRELRAKSGTAIEVNAAGQEMIRQAAEVAKAISGVEMQRSELSQRFTDQSNDMVAIREKLDILKRQKESLDDQLRSLPATESEMVKLLRDAKVASEVYTLMLNRSQELQVSKAGIVGTARILDQAVVPHFAIWPKISYVLAASTFAGIILALVISASRRLLRRRVDDPEVAEQLTGIPAFAIILHSPVQAKMASDNKRVSGKSEASRLLCVEDPSGVAVESLRSLRASLPFAMMESRNNIVAMHGPTPSMGKTFVATNLAGLVAETGKKVIVIDCDLRKGDVHRTFGVSRGPGVSEVVSGQCTLDQAVRKFDEPRVDYLTSGALPPNPAEILLTQQFANIVDFCSKKYDVVILDSPPVLNLADCVSIAGLAGTNLLVVRAGVSTTDDLKFAVRRMEKSGVRIAGLVVNDLTPRATPAYQNYYSYEYRPKTGEP
jgi:tyrosine-protein kinase Etk/Wzc